MERPGQEKEGEQGTGAGRESRGESPPPPMPKPRATARQLAFLERLDKHYRPPGPVRGLSPLEALLFLALQEGGTRKGTLASIARIRESTVDWNEARISSLSEYRVWCEPAGGRDLDGRCRHMKELLSCVYRDYNEVSLDSLAGMKLKDRRKYLESMEPLAPWMAHYLLNHLDDYRTFLFQNDMNPVLPRLGLIKRESSPVKAAEAACRLFGGHKRSLQFQCALVRHGTEICVSSIRVGLCRSCLFAEECPSSKAGG